MRGRDQPGNRRWLWAILLPIVFLLTVLTRPLPSSSSAEQNLPVIEYALTRVFGADSWSIREASLSPDGRWIAFVEGDERTRLSLWLISTKGGEPIPLTTGPYIDDSPVWFPSADRIAFRSNRTPVWALMTLPLDTITGLPTGPPRQVTLDNLSAYFDVSPDGRWIAYTASATRGGSLLRVLPAIGGTARTLAEGVLAPVWSPDGKSIYYVRGTGRSQEHSLVRVSVDAGRAETVLTWPGLIRSITHGSNRSFFFLRKPANGEGYEIANLAGHAVGRIVLPQGMSPVEISREGDQILGIKRQWTAPLHILPVEGGPARRLNEASANDEPLGWSPDGQRVLFETELSGKMVLLYAPVAGGAMMQVKLPETRSYDFTPILSGDGKHLLYAVDEGGDKGSSLRVYSIEGDGSWELSHVQNFVQRMNDQMAPTGAGGTIGRDGEYFLYYEKQNDRFELHASPPRGPSRRLWTFGEKPPRSVAVNGERIAWVENTETQASLYLAVAADAGPRCILSRQGMLDMAVWSRAGDKIAVYYFDPRRSTGKNWDPVGRDLVVLEVDREGKLVGTPRSYSIPAGHWWNPRWLPDGRKILVSGMDGNVWLVPLEQGARPVAITGDDPNGVWIYQLSPDGRNIAYPSSVQRESSIWLLELEQPLRP